MNKKHSDNIKNGNKKKGMYKILFFVMIFATLLSFVTILFGIGKFDTSKMIAYCFMFLVFLGYSFYYRRQYLKYNQKDKTNQ